MPRDDIGSLPFEMDGGMDVETLDTDVYSVMYTYINMYSISKSERSGCGEVCFDREGLKELESDVMDGIVDSSSRLHSVVSSLCQRDARRMSMKLNSS